jgi:hypothetical protein
LPFLVDDHFVPNGCFGDANCQGDVISIDSRACPPDRPLTQSLCRRFRYTPLPADAAGFVGFLGILFQDVGEADASGIGQVPGLPIEPGAQRVLFRAGAARAGLQVTFRAGGAGETDPSLPYRDEFVVSEAFTLSSELEPFQLDLSGVSYGAAVVSPFGWAIESDGTSTDPIDLFIQDVRWE